MAAAELPGLHHKRKKSDSPLSPPIKSQHLQSNDDSICHSPIHVNVADCTQSPLEATPTYDLSSEEESILFDTNFDNFRRFSERSKRQTKFFAHRVESPGLKSRRRSSHIIRRTLNFSPSRSAESLMSSSPLKHDLQVKESVAMETDTPSPDQNSGRIITRPPQVTLVDITNAHTS